MFWQNEGEFLACKIDRSTKTKKSTYPSLELFRMTERNIPIEVEEFKEPMSVFQWEPNSNRFVILTSDVATNVTKQYVSFFCMEKPSKATGIGKVKLLNRLERKSVNTLVWSPKGRYILMAGLKQFNGDLEFFDADEMQTLGKQEHYSASDLAWDNSGRFLITSSTTWNSQVRYFKSLFWLIF